MKINRNSWHYKLSLFGEHWEEYNDTLCAYTRRIFFKGTILLIVTGEILFLCYNISTVPYMLIAFLFIISAIFVSIITIFYLRKFFKKPALSFPNESIIIEYIKAKKKAICPIIEYVDE